MIKQHPSAITGEKRILSRTFRETIITQFIKGEVKKENLIIIPTDLLQEMCLFVDVPPCYLMFENNMESSSSLNHNDKITDIVIR